MDKSKVLAKLRRLRTEFKSGSIPLLHQHEVNPGLDKSSRENYLYFIMTCSLNFQRVSPRTWESALKTWNDTDTNFVFFPEIVVKREENTLRQALLKHKLALQPNKHIQIWKRLSETFHKYFSDDPRELFKQNDHDAKKVLKLLQEGMKKAFPYLSGLKLSNYFLFILLKYSDLRLKNTRAISIIPDTHIMQATEVLGILEKSAINPKSTEEAWQTLLDGTEFSPIDFHSILWNWSRNNFKPSV
ncbi:hypothetical protein HY642_01805 [Candidatus Woesearchaeota archaeon]|nr:hypothetical protein [Candidatus Woesearchaeota archaeon]